MTKSRKQARTSLKSYYNDNIPELEQYLRNKIEGLLSQESTGPQSTIISRVESWLQSKGFDQQDTEEWMPILVKEVAFSVLNRVLFNKFAKDHVSQTIAGQFFHFWEELEDDPFIRDAQNEISSVYLMDFEGSTFYHVYENFLTGSERKELGLYSTPSYIIRFILHFCLNLSSNSEFFTPPPSKILDPACGSGGFLIEAFDLFNFILKNKEGHSNKKRDISSLEGLYGLDIDPFSLQFAALNLLFKDLTSSMNSLRIMKGNALKISPSRATEFSPSFSNHTFPQGGFDWVVGNPPYFLISKQENRRVAGKPYHTTYLPPSLVREYQSRFISWPHNNRNPNIFFLFMERSIEFLKEGGILGFIIPDILLAGLSAWNCRKKIMNSCKIRAIISLDGKVFPEGGISNVIIFLEKCTNRESRSHNVINIIQTSPYEIKANDERKDYFSFIDTPIQVPQKIFETNPYQVFSVNLKEETIPIFQTIVNRVSKGDLIRIKDVCVIRRGIENLSKKKTISSPLKKKSTIRKVIIGENIKKYQIVWDTRSFSCRYIDLDLLKDTQVKIKPDYWFTQPKIVIKRVSPRLVAALDATEHFYTLDSVQMLWLKPEFRNYCTLDTILAILNSDLINFYYITLFSYKRLFARVQKIFLEELPLPKQIPMEQQLRASQLVTELQQSPKEKTSKIIIEVNQLVNQMYFSDPEVMQELTSLLTPPYSLREIPSLGPRAYFQLAMQGVNTVEVLIASDASELANKLPGINVQTIERWQQAGLKLMLPASKSL